MGKGNNTGLEFLVWAHSAWRSVGYPDLKYDTVSVMIIIFVVQAWHGMGRIK
jgi:hypothetical protein